MTAGALVAHGVLPRERLNVVSPLYLMSSLLNTGVLVTVQDEVDKAQRRARKAEKKAERERRKNFETAASTAAANVASQRSHHVSDDEGNISSDDGGTVSYHLLFKWDMAVTTTWLVYLSRS